MGALKILYLSCHSVLEADEIRMFTELGHTVFSINGAYMNPTSPSDPKRPPVEAPIQQQLMDVSIQCSKENIHPELIAWADVIYVMHRDDWIIGNWSKIKHKPVIWRTIGQSIPLMEHRLALCRAEGLKIVRYSPMEEKITGYIGHNAIIRFYKDEYDFGSWYGSVPEVMTVAQSMKKRGKYCGYDIWNRVTAPFIRHVYGPQNEDTGCDGGQLSYLDLLAKYRLNQVYFYTGTYPASYTLNFIEALMTGIPVVAIGNCLANLAEYQMDCYEIPQIIKNGVNGFYSDEESELTSYIEKLLESKELREEIGKRGRETAIELFGKETIKTQWAEFFATL